MEHRQVTINTKFIWTMVAVGVAVFVAWKLHNFIMVLLISVIIASFIETGAQGLKKIHIPRPIAVFFLYTLGFAVIAGILYLIIPLFVHEIADFIDLFPKDSLFVKLIEPLTSNGFTSASFQEILAIQNASNTSSFLGALQGVFGGLLNTMLVVIISFYLSIQEKGVEQFLRVVIPEQHEDYVVNLWGRVEKKIGYWFGGQVVVAILITIITYVGLFLMGVPYALILAAVAGLFVFVPFGTALSVAPAMVLGYFGGGIGLALQIFLFYGVVHYIESYFFTPYILHRTIGMPMLVIILSVIACLELFGLIGVVIAVPIAVLILELVYDYGNFTKKNKHV